MAGKRDLVCVTPVRLDFLCPHCDDLLKVPVQTEEGVRLCKTCFETIMSLPDQRCSDCQVTTTRITYRDKAVEKEIQKLEVWCPYKSLGCFWQGKLQDQQKHADVCEYQGVNCQHNGCVQVIAACELEHHEQECQFQSVTCNMCNLDMPLFMMHDHELGCGELESYSIDGISDRLAGNVMPENCQVNVNRWWNLPLYSDFKAKFMKMYALFVSKMWTDVLWLKNAVMNLTIWRMSVYQFRVYKKICDDTLLGPPAEGEKTSEEGPRMENREKE